MPVSNRRASQARAWPQSEHSGDFAVPLLLGRILCILAFLAADPQDSETESNRGQEAALYRQRIASSAFFYLGSAYLTESLAAGSEVRRYKSLSRMADASVLTVSTSMASASDRVALGAAGQIAVDAQNETRRSEHRQTNYRWTGALYAAVGTGLLLVDPLPQGHLGDRTFTLVLSSLVAVLGVANISERATYQRLGHRAQTTATATATALLAIDQPPSPAGTILGGLLLAEGRTQRSVDSQRANVAGGLAVISIAYAGALFRVSGGPPGGWNISFATTPRRADVRWQMSL